MRESSLGSLRLDLMSAILARPAASGAPAVIGFLYFSTWFGHGDTPCDEVWFEYVSLAARLAARKLQVYAGRNALSKAQGHAPSLNRLAADC